jgi:hypothetical protein
MLYYNPLTGGGNEPQVRGPHDSARASQRKTSTPQPCANARSARPDVTRLHRCALWNLRELRFGQALSKRDKA